MTDWPVGTLWISVAGMTDGLPATARFIHFASYLNVNMAGTGTRQVLSLRRDTDGTFVLIASGDGVTQEQMAVANFSDGVSVMLIASGRFKIRV